MLLIEAKAEDFCKSLSNQSGSYSIGEMNTAYTVGANDNIRLTNHSSRGNFGQALQSAKDGHLVGRIGWVDKREFIFIIPADSIRVDMVINQVKSIPYSVKEFYNEDVKQYKMDEKIPDSDLVHFDAYFCKKKEDGSIENG